MVARAPRLRDRPCRSHADKSPQGKTSCLEVGLSKKDDLLGASRHFPSPQADTASHEGEDGRALSVRALRAIASAGSGACELEISNSGDGPISGYALRVCILHDRLGGRELDRRRTPASA